MFSQTVTYNEEKWTLYPYNPCLSGSLFMQPVKKRCQRPD